MARANSISSTGLVALIKRRCYSAAAAAAAAAGSRGNGVASESTSSSPSSSSSSSGSASWVPDPATGYYRPGNKRAEVDAAEMRARLLSPVRPDSMTKRLN